MLNIAWGELVLVQGLVARFVASKTIARLPAPTPAAATGASAPAPGEAAALAARVAPPGAASKITAFLRSLMFPSINCAALTRPMIPFEGLSCVEDRGTMLAITK